MINSKNSIIVKLGTLLFVEINKKDLQGDHQRCTVHAPCLKIEIPLKNVPEKFQTEMFSIFFYKIVLKGGRVPHIFRGYTSSPAPPPPDLQGTGSPSLETTGDRPPPLHPLPQHLTSGGRIWNYRGRPPMDRQTENITFHFVCGR